MISCEGVYTDVEEKLVHSKDTEEHHERFEITLQEVTKSWPAVDCWQM